MSTPASVEVPDLAFEAPVFSVLCSLAGAYFVLFIIAIVSTYVGSGNSYRNLRIVTILLFLDLAAHLASHSVEFARARIAVQPADEFIKWTTPVRTVETLTTTIASFLADGLLAWRFYIVYSKKRWALYTSSIAVVICGVIGLVANFSNLAAYVNPNSSQNGVLSSALKVSMAWGACTFAVNTTLTVMILAKIVSVVRDTPSGIMGYRVALEAIIESALVTWFGLLFYVISASAPTGHYLTRSGVGFISVCILPFFFGISQCLITARLGLAKHESIKSTVFTAPVFARGYVSTNDEGAVYSRNIVIRTQQGATGSLSDVVVDEKNMSSESTVV